MTDVPRPPDGVPDESELILDDLDRLEELDELSSDAGAEFASRVSRAIERRRLTNLGLEFAWVAPLAVLRELFGMACRFSFDSVFRKEDGQ